MRSGPRVPRFPLIALLGLAAATQAPAGNTHQPQFRPLPSEKTVTVPFDLYQGYFMVLHGSIGPLRNLNFFFDTGASDPIVDSRIAKKLKLRSQAPTGIVILGGQVQGEAATLPSLALGPVQRSDLEVFTADLSFFEKYIPVRVDAIVSLGVLGWNPFVIDYSARVVRFGPTPDLPVSVPLRRHGGGAVFDAEVDQTPVHLLFDTGASSLVLFAKGAPQGSPPKTHGGPTPEAIGRFESKPIRLRSFRLGAEEFRKKAALVTDNPKPSQIDFDGLMSPAALGISRVSVDLQAGILGFSR
jgi:predicted aspartyl protease